MTHIREASEADAVAAKAKVDKSRAKLAAERTEAAAAALLLVLLAEAVVLQGLGIAALWRHLR